MNREQILDLGRAGHILSDRFDGFEWLVNRYVQLTSETPHVNAVRYGEWLQLATFMEQRIREYVPTVVFDRAQN